MNKQQCTCFLMMAIITLTGCGDSSKTWKEEVQLQSGEILKVSRTIQFEAFQPIGGSGGSDTPVSALEIIAPAQPDNPGPWSTPSLIPMLLDRDPETKEWFVVTTFYMCTAWYNIGRPKLPYAEFRYRGGQWIQVPLSQTVIGREANLLVPNQTDVKSDHTLRSKEAIMSNSTMSPRHKRVISTWATNC